MQGEKDARNQLSLRLVSIHHKSNGTLRNFNNFISLSMRRKFGIGHSKNGKLLYRTASGDSSLPVDCRFNSRFTHFESYQSSVLFSKRSGRATRMQTTEHMVRYVSNKMTSKQPANKEIHVDRRIPGTFNVKLFFCRRKMLASSLLSDSPLQTMSLHSCLSAVSYLYNNPVFIAPYVSPSNTIAALSAR